MRTTTVRSAASRVARAGGHLRATPKAALGTLALAAFAAAGCIGEMNIGSVRTGFGLVTWRGTDHPGIGDSLALDLEVSRGTDTDPAFGPIYFGVAYSNARTEIPGVGDTVEQRLGTRWRSSMLETNTSSFPYAAVGVYGGWIEPGDRPKGKIGLGFEGGLGGRIGLGPRAALDLGMMMSYGRYEGNYEVLSTRFAAAVVVRY